jgi:hypothetical protein
MREMIDRIFARLGIREAEYLIEGMARVGPKTTGEDMWFQVRMKPDAKHKEPSVKVRLKDSRFEDDKKNTSVVSINKPRVIKGPDLNKAAMQRVKVVLDRARPTLLGYWEGTVRDTEDVLDAMRPK